MQHVHYKNKKFSRHAHAVYGIVNMYIQVVMLIQNFYQTKRSQAFELTINDKKSITMCSV